MKHFRSNNNSLTLAVHRLARRCSVILSDIRQARERGPRLKVLRKIVYFDSDFCIFREQSEKHNSFCMLYVSVKILD